jgi:hypothetical protein
MMTTIAAVWPGTGRGYVRSHEGVLGQTRLALNPAAACQVSRTSVPKQPVGFGQEPKHRPVSRILSDALMSGRNVRSNWHCNNRG